MGLQKRIDLRKIKKIGMGFKKKCFFCQKEFIAYRSNATFCNDCRPIAKDMRDEYRNEKLKKERLKSKIPKELKDKESYDQFIEDISEAVKSKLLPYFFK